MPRVAMVTGAANGLGWACADRFAHDDVDLALVDVDEAALHAAAGQLSADGVRVSTHTTDVRGRDACAASVRAAVEAHGRIDVLVNAAGIYPRRPALEIGAEDWQQVFEVNVLGTYFMMVEAIAVMRGEGSGHVVNVSSVDAFTAHPDNAHYAATKAAVVSLTRSLALAAAPLGIRVNSVAPGPMATAAARATDWYEPMVEALPTRSPIAPAEVARVVAFLADPANVSIAGENVVVSGGGVIV